MRVTALTTLALLATPAYAEDSYIALNFGSLHINAPQEFNEVNPGVGFGRAWGGDRFRYGVEAGVVRNSYTHWAPYAATFAETRLASSALVDIWAGGFVGFAGYPNLINYARKKGIPTLGQTHIMVAGLTLTAEFDRIALVLNYIPFGDKMDGVAIFKIKIPFTPN